MIKYKQFKDIRLNRLAMEHELLDDFCNRSDLVSYEPVGQRQGRPPEKYKIIYKVKSIVGVDPLKNPMFEDYHEAEIDIPADFPMSSQPKCRMITSAWHPNIRSSGNFKGRICINAEALGHWHTIDMLAERIGEMLQYKNYHAIDIPPHPEDTHVAKWVRDFAEPRGIVDKKKKKYIDSRPLMKPSDEWLATRKKKISITIKGIRKTEDPKPSSTNTMISKPIRKQITIKRKN